MRQLMNLFRSCAGSTAIEYALVAALIAVAGIVAFNSLGNSIGAEFNGASNALAHG